MNSYKYKTLKSLFIFCIFLNLLACNKKELKTIGWSNSEFNGQYWYANRCSNHVDYDSILALNLTQGYLDSDKNFQTKSNLYILSLAKKKGRQYLNNLPLSSIRTAFDKINPTAFFIYYLEGVDQPCSNYMVSADSPNNWIDIEKVEGDYDKIWGSYSLTMVKDTSWRNEFCQSNIYEDTIHIINGRFYTIREYNN